jgi:hypothetical protein
MNASLFIQGMLIVAVAAVPICGSAKGSVRVQQANGSVQNYSGVTFRVVDKKMEIQTNDKAGTLIVTDAACSLGDNKILVCLPYEMSLRQNGTTRVLDFHRGTIYYNKSDSKQTLRYSSTQLPPNGILGALKSNRGTYVTFSGTLDSRR